MNTLASSLPSAQQQAQANELSAKFKGLLSVILFICTRLLTMTRAISQHRRTFLYSGRFILRSDLKTRLVLYRGLCTFLAVGLPLHRASGCTDAAFAITTLYRASTAAQKRAHNAGYTAALQDILAFIRAGLSDGMWSTLCSSCC